MIMIKSHHNLHKLVSEESERRKKSVSGVTPFDFTFCKVRDHEFVSVCHLAC